MNNQFEKLVRNEPCVKVSSYADMIYWIKLCVRKANYLRLENPDYRTTGLSSPQWRICGCIKYYRLPREGKVLAWVCESYSELTMFAGDDLVEPTAADAEKYAEFAKRKAEAKGEPTGGTLRKFDIEGPQDDALGAWLQWITGLCVSHGVDAKLSQNRTVFFNITKRES